jgi:hypothetical protein
LSEEDYFRMGGSIIIKLEIEDVILLSFSSPRQKIVILF